MAKVIIGIHGLGNKPPKDLLEDWWKKSMIEGLEKLNGSLDIPKFELVYWADILYERPLDEKIKDKKDPFYLDEKYTMGSEITTRDNNLVRKKVLDFLEHQLDKLFLNDDFTVNFEGITDVFVRRYFKDLDFYYALECLDKNDIRCKARILIRERLVEVLEKHKGKEIMLIGHSMGSIVAYDVLLFSTPKINIQTFITMGSPLGFPVVQGKIAMEWNIIKQVTPKLKTPPGVKKHWYNFADLKDKVALIYHLRDKYKANWYGIKPRDFVVSNNYQIDNEPNHHKSFGYLRTSEFSRVLSDFSIRKSLWEKFVSIISKK